MRCLNTLLALTYICWGWQRANAQAMVIHMNDGSEQTIFTNQISYIDFLEDAIPDDERLTGTWYLGWWCVGNIAIHFDGTEYMSFEGDHLDWGGRQDGQESYTLKYNNDFSAFDAMSLQSSKVETFTIIEKSENRIALENGGAIRYFYPSQFDAQNSDSPIQEEEHYKPDPSHQPTTDLGTILGYSYGFTHSDMTPMGAHFENVREASSSELDWLANPAEDPLPIAGLPSWANMTVCLYPYDVPQPADVNQHAIGDCSVCAVLASLAYIYPDFIKSIIHDNGDGTYIVDMFDPKGLPVQVGVQNTFLVDWTGTIGQVSGKNNIPTWATILEKALIKWEEVFKVDYVEGIGSEFAAPLFTGCGDSFAFAPNSLYSSELKQAVLWSLDNGRITIGGFDEGDIPCGELYTVVAHAFTLMYPRYDSDLFAMRNPWGITSVDGLLDVPDERRITQAIDIRTIEPGAAAPYKRTDLGAYQIPEFSSRPNDAGVSERVLTHRYLLDLPIKERNRILNLNR